MESQYEEQLPARKPGMKKPFIDFYKQGEQSNNFQQTDLASYSNTLRGQYDGSQVQSPSENQIFRQESETKLFNQIRSDNFLDQNNKNQQHDKMKEDYKKMIQDNKAVASKRRSVENSEAILHNRQNEGRQLMAGAKSALNNYPSHQSGSISSSSGMQQLKQINKNKIERDYLMDNNHTNQQQQLLFQNTNSISQQQQKRTLAKSQSQNRLLLVSPETLMNKNNPYTDIYQGLGQNHQEKNSFSDQSQVNQAQDLLYKQHLQYSSNNQSHQQKAWQLKGAQSHILSHLSTKDCTYCNKTGGIHSHSLIPPQCSAIFCKDSVGMMIQNNLSKKYSTNRDYYNLKIVNDLIYNENTHIVSIFKDFLILDDINEFLKRSYTTSETKVRLPKLCSFYDKYSQVFPNYVILPESKYMFKNIQRKQKLIDEQYQLQEEIAKKLHQTLLDEDKMFNSNFYNSVYRMDLSMSRQQYEDQAKNIASISGRPVPIKRIDQMQIDELVDRFLMKDSESNIQLITTAGLDFSGFTMQSTFINEKTPSKQMIKPQTNSNKQSTVQQQSNKVTQQLQMIQKSQAAVGQRKESLQQKKSGTNIASAAIATNRKQKVSFNNTQQNKGTGIVPKLDTNKATMSNASGSTKTTPRLQKNAPYTNNLNNNHEENIMKQQIQTSPDTKQALQNYLHNCQIEQITPNQEDLYIQAQQKQQLQNLESPMMQSPQFALQKQLLASQTSLSQQQTHSLSNGNRQLMKSQCVIPTIQFNQGNSKEITNLKKTNRLSQGNYNQSKQINAKKQNTSPVPIQNLQTQQSLTRNIVSNSTQKSLKSVNSHAKYLSGGNDQYQRLLNQQNPYATHETITTNTGHNFNSSNKKAMETFQKHQNENIITNEDCDDAGIADERFASPDIFSTADGGRKSISRQAGVMLTSCEDNRILSQCNNYDQIKKHLEQYITINQQIDSNSNKKFIATMSSEKMQQQFESESRGYNKPSLVQSATDQQNNSRNGTAGKHFESLKQKIRGVFEVDTSVSQSANKTPNKSSTHQHQQNTILAQNRMSIESKDNIMLQGCLSSTSAAGRTLSFAQFSNNQQNYRSITNMQQRKSSKQQESSIESKRLSQNRQSFKEAQQQQQEKIKRCATGKTLSINDINQHTFGTINNQSGTPYLQSVTSATTLCNPTFIQSHKQQNQQYSTHHQQQNSMQQTNQAANTVRVMTPSYSLASLSKLISPTQSTSPITMTVTLASQGRKQTSKKSSGQNQYNPSQSNLIPSSSHQNFLIADKNNKIITSSHKTNNLASKSNRTTGQQQQIRPQIQKNVKLQQSGSQEAFQITPRGIQQQQPQQKTHIENSQNLSCTISTENNSSKKHLKYLLIIAAKAVESKNPKFMRTIEEYSMSTTQQQPQYNTMLSASMGHRKSGTGLSGSISQAQLEMKQKQKIQTVVNSNQASIKRSTGNQQTTTVLSSSASVSHFKSPSQQLHSKKKYI